jgi:hypothetical protein
VPISPLSRPLRQLVQPHHRSCGPNAPVGQGVVRDSGLPDVVAPSAFQHAVEDLPPETLVFLLGSRYCETDRLSEAAWSLFQKSAPGWVRAWATEEGLRGATARELFDGYCRRLSATGFVLMRAARR